LVAEGKTYNLGYTLNWFDACVELDFFSATVAIDFPVVVESRSITPVSLLTFACL